MSLNPILIEEDPAAGHFKGISPAAAGADEVFVSYHFNGDVYSIQLAEFKYDLTKRTGTASARFYPNPSGAIEIVHLPTTPIHSSLPASHVTKDDRREAMAVQGDALFDQVCLTPGKMIEPETSASKFLEQIRRVRGRSNGRKARR
ncbi:hypothetical protein [Bradyrhizobium erythrophlei]|nr:hypothetical protein [Bradyrhizobium erythrophlei]